MQILSYVGGEILRWLQIFEKLGIKGRSQKLFVLLILIGVVVFSWKPVKGLFGLNRESQDLDVIVFVRDVRELNPLPYIAVTFTYYIGISKGISTDTLTDRSGRLKFSVPILCRNEFIWLDVNRVPPRYHENESPYLTYEPKTDSLRVPLFRHHDVRLLRKHSVKE